jgi:hypothetical protein
MSAAERSSDSLLSLVKDMFLSEVSVPAPQPEHR